jgi:hypothetical protein
LKILLVGKMFGFRNAEFIDDLGPLTKRVAGTIFSVPVPKNLYHYTKSDTAEKIVATKQIWATCLTEQADLTELNHGIALVERVAMELMDLESNGFVRRLLSNLPELMRARRSMIFITCFCGTSSSNFHLNEYGAVCLRFEFPKPSTARFLDCNNLSGDSWLTPVIYKESDQIKAIRLFLEEASKLLKKHSQGDWADDRGGWIASGPMRDVAQCLLTIVSGFKREIFSKDCEWRLLVSPKLALTSSAPQMIDDAFSTSIFEQPKRHVCLRRYLPFVVDEGTVWPPDERTSGYPFDELTYHPLQRLVERDGILSRVARFLGRKAR